MNNKIIENVSSYYAGKLAQHGSTAKGVDWNSEESQILRYQQLLKVIKIKDDFSILDYGCGYGALIEVLNHRNYNYTYTGYDISEEMLDSARLKFGKEQNISFASQLKNQQHFDYAVASGIFNVKLSFSTDEWQNYVLTELDSLVNFAQKGVAFNCLTSYSDKEYMRKDLFYADPKMLFDYCKTRYSRQVALLHDYGLYEFTMIIRL